MIFMTKLGFYITLLSHLSLIWSVSPAEASVSPVERITKLGKIVGRRVVEASIVYEAYINIPYALPPLGTLRFQPPVALKKYDDIVDARDERANKCPQLVEGSTAGSEDCLYLNVYVPEDAASLPVMVFVHGGDFATGSGSQQSLGPQLLIAQDVILVTINYRLGVLGFLTTLDDRAPGNQGLRDTMMAVDWVSEHIPSFGGDSGRITVFGQGAGSEAVSILLVTEQKFQRAILQSGALAIFFLRSMEDRKEEYAIQLGNHLGCDEARLIECLQGMSVDQLVLNSNLFKPFRAWEPTIDAALGDLSVLPQDPLSVLRSGQMDVMDIIIGSNDGDGMAFLANSVYNDPEGYLNLQKNFSQTAPPLMLRRNATSNIDITISERLRYFYLGENEMSPSMDLKMMELMTDDLYQAGGRFMADLLVGTENFNVFQYMFTYVGSVTNNEMLYNISRPELGACHADELLYLFNSTGDSPLVTPKDKFVSESMVKMWTNFAKTGDPNEPENVDTHWVPLSLNNKGYLNIGESLLMENSDEYQSRISFWNSIFNGPDYVNTEEGLVSGTFLTTVNGRQFRSFQGIPYARAPVGANRFMDPMPPLKRVNILKADKIGPKCPQLDAPYPMSDEPSEDCLYLNIYTPETNTTGTNLPVMAYIHGGALVRGSGGTYFHGPEYLLDENILLVTINHRLGALGFLSLESEAMTGNQGLKDQAMALRWIKNNIRQFGGNPEEVTLFGQSAGGFSVVAHLSSPVSHGLISKAIAQSGSVIRLPGTDTIVPKGVSRKITLALADYLGCSNKTDDIVISCLQGQNVHDILHASWIFSHPQTGYVQIRSPYRFVVDKDFSPNPFLPVHPEEAYMNGDFHKVPFMAGFTKDEGIYNADRYILDPKALEHLNEKWDIIGPKIVFDKKENVTEEEKHIVAAIREFYFGEEDISMNTIQSLINMFSDKSFWSSVHRTIVLAALHQKAPVYEYMFSHKGTYSFADWLGLNSSSLGVCHADDVHYLFNPHAVEFPALGTDEDKHVRDLMVKMWTNFAKFGNPTPDQDQLGFVWNQFFNERPEYLYIDTKPRMDFSEEFRSRMDFWDSLFPLAISTKEQYPELTVF